METRGLPSITRRSLILGAASAVTVAALPSPAPGTLRRPAWTTLAGPDWNALRRKVSGPVLRPGDPGYATATRTFDPRRDHLRPLAVVQVTRAADVLASMAFAERYSLPVRPRSGGHSYVGASTGNGVLVIDTGRLNAIRPDSSWHTVRVGAGVRLGSLHVALDGHDRTVPTGTCPTVGVSGLTLGGGIGAESRLYGLTLDSVLSIRIVTADGRNRLVSADDDPRLFWALRGGGGGNFGIVTEFVIRTSASHPAEFFSLRWSSSRAADVVQGWLQRLATMPRSCWANVHLDAFGRTLRPRIVGIAWGSKGRAEARAMIKAVGAQPVTETYRAYSHREAMQALAGSAGSRRQSWVAGSDILNAPLTAGQTEALVAAVRRGGAAGSSATLILDPLDGAVHDGSAATSSFPWRQSVASCQWYVGLPSQPSTAQVKGARMFVTRGHAALGGKSAGAYVNYLEPGRPMKDYYGRGWAALVEAARVYDPSGVLASTYTLP